MIPIHADLRERAQGLCELCGQAATQAFVVPPFMTVEPDRAIATCAACSAQLEPDADGEVALDEAHWTCLQDSAWSQVPAVQVVAWRLLQRLDQPWAVGLRDQIYLDDETLAWAEDDGAPAAVVGGACVDSNGATLAEGDAVTLIKDLVVKGANFTAKRGTLVRTIHLTDDPGLVEGKVSGTQIVLKTCFLKRVVA